MAPFSRAASRRQTQNTEQRPADLGKRRCDRSLEPHFVGGLFFFGRAIAGPPHHQRRRASESRHARCGLWGYSWL